MSVEGQEVICAQAWISQVYIEQSSQNLEHVCTSAVASRSCRVLGVLLSKEQFFHLQVTTNHYF